MKLWTWDIETVDWDQPVCAVATSEDGDVERYFGPECIERMADFMLEQKGCYVAHYGGGFDVPLMLNHHKFKRIILSGSNILCAEENRDLKLRDSFPWFLSSLEKMGKAIGVEKSATVDRGNIAAHSENEILDYCEQDCRVLLAGVKEAQNFLDERRAQRAWTAGASAINLLRALEPGAFHAMDAHKVDAKMMQWFTENALTGGRVECPARGYIGFKDDKDVHCYDFKSSYPARYANRPLGIGLRKATRKDRHGVWRCSWTWPHRFKIPPALDRNTMAGVGECEGWLVDDEIECFESIGIKVRRHEGYAPECMLNIGQVFLKEMFAAKESGGPQSFFAKVWANSLSGKFSERPKKECFTSWRPETNKYLVEDGLELHGSWWRYNELKADKNGFCSSHAQPMAAAMVLGRARAALWKAIHAVENAGWEVYYCDTDSIHTNCPPDKMPIPLGVALGDLAYEAGPCRAVYLGPKAYLLIEKSTGKIVKSAMKGVPLKNYERGTIETRKADGVLFDVVREAKRARPGRAAEPSHDLRMEVFHRALRGGAHCEKDGITSFLRGLNMNESWKRAPMVRIIRPSGRGKTFHPTEASGWAYLSTLEISCLAAVRMMPCKLGGWERIGEKTRAHLVRERLVMMKGSGKQKRFLLTEKGDAWLKAFGGGADSQLTYKQSDPDYGEDWNPED